MKLEQQVCSLELAQKLQELGVKQESLFDWVGHPVSPSLQIEWHLEYGEHQYDAYYAAFTVAELGEMLPFDYGSQRCDDGQWMCKEYYQQNYRTEEALTEADARAKMLIYLIENDLLK